MSIRDKIREAAERNRVLKKSDEADTVVQDRARKLREQREREEYVARKRAIYERWIHNVLPELVENFARKGIDRVDLTEFGKLADNDKPEMVPDWDILAATLRAEGLTVVSTERYVPGSDDPDFRHDPYYVSEHVLVFS